MPIRRITKDDVELLIKYLENLLNEDPRWVETVKHPDSLTKKRELNYINTILDWQKSGRMFALVCENNGDIVCFGEYLKRFSNNENHMADLRFGVLSGHEDSAKKLVSDIITKARESGIEMLIYTHFRTQKAGISIVKRLGFKKCGTIPRYYKRGNTYTDRVIYTKIL
jgi:hypothetical protein